MPMQIFLFYFLFSTVNCVRSSLNTVDINPTTICSDENLCDTIDSIIIPSTVENCTKDLLFNYGDDKQAYLSKDGKIKPTSGIVDCDLGYKRLKYALNDVFIDVVKHKNGILVENFVNNKDNPLSQFIKEKKHDFIQYMIISCAITAKVFALLMKFCSSQLKSKGLGSVFSAIKNKSSDKTQKPIMISDPTPELGRPAPVPTYQPTAADWQHIYAQVPSGIQNNHPAQFYNNLLRNAQSVSNVNEIQPQNTNMMRPASSVQNVSRSGRATGRSTQQKLPNDLQCIKCGLWFTKGPSMNAHNRANANKAICD